MPRDQKTLLINRVHLKHLRCFTEKTIDLGFPLLLIEGENGSGKTSLLEALYYSCYLHSFRATSTKEMIREGHTSFFIHLDLAQQELDQVVHNEIQVGFSREKRLVKINKKKIESHKELIGSYRVMSITEDDLSLITGSPQVRRTFIDQALALMDVSFIELLKQFRRILEQRNAYLERRSYEPDVYRVLTAQLWTVTVEIQTQRQRLLDELQKQVNSLALEYLENTGMLGLVYQPKKASYSSLDDFLMHNPSLAIQEQRYGRSLFGAHLDDLDIVFYEKRSKVFASRGQQKLLIVLLKIAQLQLLLSHFPGAVLLLDDFMTDFDQERLKRLLALLTNLDIQLIITSPIKSSVLNHELAPFNPHIISFSI